MRIVIILLVFANLAFFAYTWLDSGGGERCCCRISATRQIKLLTPQQVAALGPSKWRRSPTCASKGTLFRRRAYACPDRSRGARARTPAVAKARRIRQRLLGQHGPVRDARLGRKPDRRPARARRQGPRGRRRRQRSVCDLIRRVSHGACGGRACGGARAARREARQGATPAANHCADARVVRDPQQPVLARLKDLQAQYPGSEIKITACERPS